MKTDRIIDCVPCARGGDTPLQMAARTFGVEDEEYGELVDIKLPDDEAMFEGETFYGLGLQQGMRGIEPSSERFDPYTRENPAEIRAWLFGYTAGQIAKANDWKSETCQQGNPKEHGKILLGVFQAATLRVASFPANAFRASRYALDLIEFAWEHGRTPGEAARMVINEIIEGGIESGVALPIPATTFDPNPKVPVGASRQTYFERYINRLDKEDENWPWRQPFREFCPELRNVALERRRERMKKYNTVHD